MAPDGASAAVAVEGRPVVGVARVNWQDPSSFPLPQADVVLGSDLVYDAGILKVLVPAVGALLRPGGYLLYSCPTTERDGMSELVAVSAVDRCISLISELFTQPSLHIYFYVCDFSVCLFYIRHIRSSRVWA